MSAAKETATSTARVKNNKPRWRADTPQEDLLPPVSYMRMGFNLFSRNDSRRIQNAASLHKGVNFTVGGFQIT
jgi:hypothetical protein